MKTLQKIFLFSFVLLNFGIFFSQKVITKSGTTIFEASVPSFEEVKASNNATTAILNKDNGEFATLVLINGFKFKSALMEEHFNENYMDSSKYPKATFKGKITNFSAIKDKGGKAVISGILEIHGKQKNVTSEGMLSKSGNGYNLDGSFLVKPQDFGIEIPSLVSKKIAKDVKITYQYQLK